jgi:hypothetical protein
MYRSIARIAGLLLLSPLAALGQQFEAVDTLRPSSAGDFLAYPGDPITPYELWAQFGMMYDTNILRRTTGDNNETVARAGVGGRWDGRIAGRQGLHLAGQLDGYAYNKFSDLDNVGYSAAGDWRWRLGPHLAVRGGADLVNYHRPTHEFSNTQGVVYTAGADYVTNLGNTLGVEYRVSHGDSPVNRQVDPTGQFTNNDFKQSDLAVVATWLVGPTLRFAGNVGRTHRTYTQLPNRDFTGPTYRAAARWAPSTKTYLDFEAAKTVQSVIDIGAAHVIARSVSFGPGWALTAKTNVTARFIRQHLDYGGPPPDFDLAAFGLTANRQEIVRTFRLGTYWEYTRRVHVTAAWENGERESNQLGRNYRFNAYMANLRLIF